MESREEILQLGELLDRGNEARPYTALAREFIASDKGLDEFKAEALKRMRANQPTVQPGQSPVALTPDEQKRYSIGRAILLAADGGSGFEREVSDEIGKKLGRSPQNANSIFVPTGIPLHKPDDFKRALQLQRTPLTTTGAATGSDILFTQEGTFIDMLRATARVIRLGARMLPGLTGAVAFPKQTGAGTLYWVGENPGSDVTESNIALDQVVLSPKTAMAQQSYSRQLLRQSAGVVDNLVTDDLRQTGALGLDRAALHGAGGNEPVGVYAASGVSPVPFNGPITFPKVVQMETEVATDNADIGTMGYLTTPGVRGAAKTTQKFSGTNGEAIWTGGADDGEMNGYRAEVSTQVRSNMGVGSDEHGILLRRGANTVRLRRNAGTTDVDRIYLSATGTLPTPPPGEPPDYPIGPYLPYREATNLIDEGGPYPTNPDNPLPFYNAVQGFDANGYFEGYTTAGGQARFELFAGKETQPQSAIIVAVEGASETPAFRDVSYFVTEDYLVKDGQLGNFIFEIEPEIQKLDEILLYLYTLDGKVTAADCDFSALSDITPSGVILDHRAPLEEWVTALETWFNFDIVPRGGKIEAVKRGGAVVTRIYERELRAHLFGEERPRAAVAVTHEDPVDLPGGVDVLYLDPSPSKDFHTGNQTAQKIVGFAFDRETLTFPVVGDPDSAQAVAQRFLDARHLAAKPGEMVCGFGRRYLIPTDIVEVELEDATLYTYRITQKHADLQGLVRLRVVPERASIYGQGGAGFSGRGGHRARLQLRAVRHRQPARHGDE